MALEAVGSTVLRAVVPSLGKLLKYEWGLEKTVKKGLRILEGELMSMHAFLEDVSGMPPDKLESQVKIWAGEVRELSHAIETRLHSFMTRIESTKGTLVSAPSKLVINHQMDNYIKETLIEVKGLRDQHGTYPSKSSMKSSTSAREGGTRMFAMSTRISKPVGLEGAIAGLTEKLSKGDHVSIVGMAGMGKTTLAQAVYDKIKGDFDCGAFVHIGQSADLEKVLTDILCALHFDIYYDKEPDKYQPPNINQRIIIQLQLRKFIENKRCLIVIDDILDEGTWNLVEGVFQDSARSQIITTTRNRKVAEVVGVIYPMEELSAGYSKELLLAKAKAKSDDTEFDIVADKIYHKCGGVPIAITLIGRFLAKKKSNGWHVAYDAIGFDEHKIDGASEHIKKVLSSSYYDLSYDVQRCFLYLSMFPEGHLIEKNMLIWRWVAEGLVGDGSFEVGESYFNELLDRSMIQGAVSPSDVGQGGCRVHSLMFDLIRKLSSSQEHNFSTVLEKNTPQTKPIHRLAIHKPQNQNTSLEVGEVLSFYASQCTGTSFPALRKFKRLRVIDLEGCDLSAGDCKLEHLGKLDGLGYVGLVHTPVAELPKKIGRLKFLQTLDVRATGISELSPFVEDLRKLRCLRAGRGTRMMGRIGELTSLEELWLHSADKSPNLAAELWKLSEMRVLVIHFDEMDDDMQETLVVSLHQLKKLQVLQVWSDAEEKVRLGCWEGSVPSPELRQLLLFGVVLPRRMPWIHKSCVPKLSKLLLQVETLEAQDMKMLGQMPSLRSLYIHSEEDKYRLSYTANKNEFQVLEYLNTNIELICGDGGLPMIQELEVGGIRAGRDAGLRGNMPLLKKATYHLDCQSCLPLRVHKAEEELRQASQVHPNCPTLFTRRWNNTLTEMWDIFEPIEVTSPLSEKEEETSRGGRDTMELLSEAGAVVNRILDDNPAFLENVILQYLAPFQAAVGAPPALRVGDGDATDATAYPPQGLAFFVSVFDKFLHEPNYIALITQNKGADADTRLAGNDDGAGPSREPPPEVDADSMLYWLNSPDGVALSSRMAAGCGMHHDAYVTILKKCLRNPKMIATMSSVARNGDFSDMASCFENNTVMMDLMNPDILDYFAKQHTDRRSSTSQYADGGRPADIASSSAAQGMGAPSAELGTAGTLLSWLNSPDGAVLVSKIAAAFGMDAVAYERIMKKCMLNPTFIAAIDSAKDDGSEFESLMDQLVRQAIRNYRAEQGMDRPFSTSGYAGGGRADAGSTSVPPPESNSPDGENFSLMSAVQQALAAGGASSGQPSAAQLESVVSWISSPHAAAFVSAGAAKLGMDPVAVQRMWKKCWLNPKNPEMFAAMHRALQNSDDSEFNRLLAGLMAQESMNYIAEQYMDMPSSRPPPKLNTEGIALSWLDTLDGATYISEGATMFGMDIVAFERIAKKCIQNPNLIAAIDNAKQDNDDSELKRALLQLMEPGIENYFAEQDMAGPSSRPPHKLDTDDIALSWLDTLDGVAFLSKGAATFGVDPVAFERLANKCVQNPDLIAVIDNAKQNNDDSELKHALVQLILPGIENYFTEQDIDGPSSRPPPKLDIDGIALSWLDTLDGAAFISEGAATFGMDPVAFERIAKKCIQDPDLIAVIDNVKQNNDDFELKHALVQLMLPGIENYFTEQDIDGSSSRPPAKLDIDGIALSWLDTLDGAAFISEGAATFGVDLVAFERIAKKCIQDPDLIAVIDNAKQNNDDSELKHALVQLMLPGIENYFVEQDMDGPFSMPQPKFDTDGAFLLWRNTPDAGAAISEEAAKFGMDPAAFERIMKKSVLNPELTAAIESAVQNVDGSEFERLMDQLAAPQTMSEFAEQYMGGPPKRDTVGDMLSWLNSPDGAAIMSEEAAKSGINDAAYERICKKCMVDPRLIAVVDRTNDASESGRLLLKLMDEEFIKYFAGQDIDEPSSTPGYAGGGRADACSTSSTPAESSGQDGEKALSAGARSGQPSAAQVEADSAVMCGGPANDRSMFSGLSSDDPALTAQSDMIDAVASSLPVWQRRVDKVVRSSPRHSTLSELSAALDKAAADESSGQPSSAQPDNVEHEEGGDA